MRYAFALLLVGLQLHLGALNAASPLHWTFGGKPGEKLPGDVPATDAAPAGKTTGAARIVESTPGRWTYDPLTQRSVANTTSLHLDAGADLTVPLPRDFAWVGFTLEAFARCDALKLRPNSTAPVLRIVGDGEDNGSAEIHLYQSHPPHSYPWWQAAFTMPGGKSRPLNRNVYKGLTHANDNDWKHVAAVYDAGAGSIEFHVDYTLVQRQSFNAVLLPRSGSVTMGGGFAGRIDEVRLTPRPLKAHQFLRATNQELSNVRFESADNWLPRQANYVDLKLRYGAVGDGKTDDTTAFQKAFRELASRVPLEFNTLYIPEGTYRIRDTIHWSRFLVVQGAGPGRTILRLDDRAAGFDDVGKPRPVLVASNFSGGGGGSGSAIASYLFDLTLDTGRGNPGAVAFDFHANNVGAVERVAIRSGDGAGVAGISMLRPWPGPALISQVTIDGFDYGIDLAHREYSMTLDQVTLSGQRRAGVRNRSNILAISRLTSRNRAPAVLNQGAEAMVTLIDSTLAGGAADAVAIDSGTKGGLFVRNVRIADYGSALRDEGQLLPRPESGRIDEHVSGAVLHPLGPRTRSLGCRTAERPNPEWPAREQWVNVADFADRKVGDDWAPALQAAIDSGARALYLPANGHYPVKQPVRLRGKVEFVCGMMNGLNRHRDYRDGPVLIVEDPGPALRWLERIELAEVVHASASTLVIRHGGVNRFTNRVGCGPLYLENIGGADWQFEHPQKVHARQWNVERHGPGPCIVCRGTTLWALGFKTEYESCKLDARSGSRIEILGAFIYPIGKIPADRPIFQSEDSWLSLVYGTSIYQSGQALHVRETRKGKAHEVPGSAVPFHGSRQKMSLYVSGDAVD